MTEPLIINLQQVAAPQYPADADQVYNTLVSSVGSATIRELAITLAITGLTCLFVATTAGVVVLLASAITIVALNAIFRSIGAYASYRLFTLQNDQSPQAAESRAFYTSCRDFMQFLAPFTFSNLHLTTGDVLVHEGGHALAATALYKGAEAEITVFPWTGGVTEYYPQELTALGEWVGRENAELITSAAGSGCALLFSTTYLLIAGQIADSHPELARYLEMMGFMSILRHVIYALSALAIQKEGHDFAALAAGGIHPLVAVAFLVLIPLVAKCILYGINQCCSETPPADPAGGEVLLPA